jgi:hypothetical protein
VLGVYVDWNANSKVLPFDRFPFDNLTFWSKQRVADRIAQSGVTTKIISSISSVMSEGRRSLRSRCARDGMGRSVLIMTLLYGD